MKNTKVFYMYRCAGNYKYTGEVILRGSMEDLDLEDVIESTFIAEQVNFPVQFPEELDSELDHPWHEIVDFEPTDEDALDDGTPTLRQFVKRLEELDWDEQESQVYGELSAVSAGREF